MNFPVSPFDTTRRKAKDVAIEKDKGSLVLAPEDIITVRRQQLTIDSSSFKAIHHEGLPLSMYVKPSDQFVDKVAAKLMVKSDNQAPGFARLITPWLKKADTWNTLNENYINARHFTFALCQALSDKWPDYFNGGKVNASFIHDGSANRGIGQRSRKDPHFDKAGNLALVGLVPGPNHGISGGSSIFVNADALHGQHNITQEHLNWAFNARNVNRTLPSGVLAHLTKANIRQLVKKYTLTFWSDKHPQLNKPCITPWLTNNRGTNQDYYKGIMGPMHGATPVTALNPKAERHFFRVWGK